MNDWEEYAPPRRPAGQAGSGQVKTGQASRARQVARAVAEREEGRRRLNATTMTVALASVAVAGAVTAILPGTSHAASTSTGGNSSSGSSSSSGSTAGSGTSNSSNSSGSNNTGGGTSNNSSSGQGGFQAPANPPQVGGGGGFGSTSGGS